MQTDRDFYFWTGRGCDLRTGPGCDLWTGRGCDLRTGPGCDLWTGRGCDLWTGRGCDLWTGRDLSLREWIQNNIFGFEHKSLRNTNYPVNNQILLSDFFFYSFLSFYCIYFGKMALHT